MEQGATPDTTRDNFGNTNKKDNYPEFTPMKTIAFIFTLLVCVPAVAQRYDRFFTDATMRVDYYHTGTKGQEAMALDKVYDEGSWPGSKTVLIDTLNLGDYMVRVYDVLTNSLIFSHGFSSMFNEWQTTDEAVNGIVRTFHETVRFPFPKQRVMVTIARRDKFVAGGEKLTFREVFSTTINPNDPTEVNREKRKSPFATFDILNNGPAETSVDLLILGDGYTKLEMEKFRKDARFFADALLKTSPFKEHKKSFNVRAIEVISEESGIDKPDKNIWKKSALNTMYNTFGSARYVLIEDNKTLRDIAGSVPYDYVTVLINDDRYGGGGIYNQYTTAYTKNDVPGQEWQMEYVYVHEFGHCFGGLGDEYYTSQVSYTEFYPKGIEPWEPNITAKKLKADLKWKSLVDESTPIPTPWDKSEFDSLEALRGKLDRLAPDYYQKREPLIKKVTQLLKSTKYAGRVGTFEGASYVSKGLYRPAADCRMFTLSLADFDPVCSAAIENVIVTHTR